MKKTEAEKKIIQNLLSADADAVMRTLSELDGYFSEKVTRAIILIWQLSEDNLQRDMAHQLLQKYLSDKDLNKINISFGLFKSVNEVFPWTDDNANEIQDENFKKFLPVLKDYEAFFSKFPHYTELLLDLGRKLYMLFNREKAAEDIFISLVKNNPKIDEALYALGRIEEKKLKNESALNYFEKAIEANEKNYFAHLQAGILKAKFFNRQHDAVEHFNKVVETDPYSVEPYVRIAEAYFDLNDIPRSKQNLEIALGINEYNEDALNLLGMIYWKVDNNTEKAIETFQKGIDHKIHKDSPLLLKSLGDIYTIQMLDFEKGRLFYEKSLQINPGQKDILQIYLPLLLKEFQDLHAVEQKFENFLQVNEDVEIMTDFAEFLIEYLNDYERANDYLHKALEIDSDNNRISRLLKRTKDHIDIYQLNEPFEKDLDTEEDDWDEEWIEIEFDDDDDDDDDFAGGSPAGDQ